MEPAGKIHTFSSVIRWWLTAFVLVLTLGYATGFVFLKENTGLNASGIKENYLGNEGQKQAPGEDIKYKMSKREILTTVHNHSISFCFIFFSLGAILVTTSVPGVLKKFLLVEPFISVILTFGGIWVMWKGVLWFRYVIIISGILLNLSLITMVLLILWQLWGGRRMTYALYEIFIKN